MADTRPPKRHSGSELRKARIAGVLDGLEHARACLSEKIHDVVVLSLALDHQSQHAAIAKREADITTLQGALALIPSEMPQRLRKVKR